MAITTADGLIAGMQYPRFFSKAVSNTPVAGKPLSTWATAGIPGAGSFDTSLNGVTLSGATNGALPFTNPGSGSTYLNRYIAAMSTSTGLVTLCDRLWHNGGFTITSTSAQNITSPTWPARDVDGSTNGNGVLLGMEISSGTGAGTPTITVSYTNQAGTSGRTATNLDTTSASAVAGSFYRIGLQAGDTGVRSVQSVTLSATWTSGTMNLVAYRPIATSVQYAAEAASGTDTLTGGLPVIYNDSVLWSIFINNSTTALRVHGVAQWTQG